MRNILDDDPLLEGREQRQQAAFRCRYLKENQDKRSIADQALHLRHLDKYIGDLDLGAIHMGTLQPFIDARIKD